MIIDGPTFLAGTAISNVLSLGAQEPRLLITPQEWTTPANLLCLFSPDSTNFYPLYMEGKLWEVACPPNAALILAPYVWPKNCFVRLISGFVGEEIEQEEQREFKVIVD